MAQNEQYTGLCKKVAQNTEQLNQLKMKEVSITLQKEVDILCNTCDEHMRKLTEVVDNRLKYSEEMLKKQTEIEQKNAEKRLSDWKITHAKLEKLMQALLKAEAKSLDITELLKLSKGGATLTIKNSSNTSSEQLTSLLAASHDLKQALWQLKGSACNGFSIQSADYVETQYQYEQNLRVIDFDINKNINKVNRLLGLYQSQQNHLESVNLGTTEKGKNKGAHCTACGETIQTVKSKSSNKKEGNNN